MEKSQMRSSLWLMLAITFSLMTSVAMADEHAKNTSYGIGRAASALELKKVDISVFPNGVGLPEGRGTPAEGKVIYQQQCAACHGDNGEGRPEFPAVIGGRGTLATPMPLLTVGSYWPYATSVFDYIRRAMPYATPGSLTNDQVYAVTAWLLYKNDIVAESIELNKHSLSAVKMPNREGFVRDPRPDVKAKR
jgi:mono/diheme cytochrome c family protein